MPKLRIHLVNGIAGAWIELLLVHGDAVSLSELESEPGKVDEKCYEVEVGCTSEQGRDQTIA